MRATVVGKRVQRAVFRLSARTVAVPRMCQRERCWYTSLGWLCATVLTTSSRVFITADHTSFESTSAVKNQQQYTITALKELLLTAAVMTIEGVTPYPRIRGVRRL